jgi:hypothetical protein
MTIVGAAGGAECSVAREDEGPAVQTVMMAAAGGTIVTVVMISAPVQKKNAALRLVAFAMDPR